VRSITPNRRTSRDAACTMVIGKDTPLGPSNVKASHVTSTSAIISWLPSNSNHQHVVCVNNVEVRTVKPGVYRHTITGMMFVLLQWSAYLILYIYIYILNYELFQMQLTCSCWLAFHIFGVSVTLCQ